MDILPAKFWVCRTHLYNWVELALAVAQWSEHLWLKQEALGLISDGHPGFFLFQLAC